MQHQMIDLTFMLEGQQRDHERANQCWPACSLVSARIDAHGELGMAVLGRVDLGCQASPCNKPFQNWHGLKHRLAWTA